MRIIFTFEAEEALAINRALTRLQRENYARSRNVAMKAMLVHAAEAIATAEPGDWCRWMGVPKLAVHEETAEERAARMFLFQLDSKRTKGESLPPPSPLDDRGRDVG